MFFYTLNNKILVSFDRYNYDAIIEEHVKNSNDQIYFLKRSNPACNRRSYCISDSSLLLLESEGINLLKRADMENFDLPEWLIKKIDNRKVMSVNTEYPDWEHCLDYSHPLKWNINIAGLGDVGSMLTTGLKLLGGNLINRIGIFDLDEKKVKRLEYEENQILTPFDTDLLPEIIGIDESMIFDCDMFIFCVTAGVPSIGEETSDVRISQYKSNSRIINMYADKARQENFKGIFAVVSDPVDQLCKSAFLSSNMDKSGSFDFKGLAPEQIRGYGLGVMNARAVYYSKQDKQLSHYMSEGRAFGPHGDGLVIADSIENYNNELSLLLTEKAKNANLDVRKTGFKPYIAPALSSGTISILNTISGKWHYSSTFMGGTFMGAVNRLTPSGIEIERLNLPDKLMERILNTYERLSDDL